MAEFTKGEWKIDDRVKFAINVGRKHIAMVNVFNAVEPEIRVTENEGLANARLIAAAPDLLRVCENFFEWQANHFEDFDDEINGQLLCLANDAEAAIAKAKP